MHKFKYSFVPRAVNYRSMRSERAVGRAISEMVQRGTIKREQVVVCTKGGYLTFDVDRPTDPRKWIQENYVKAGIFSWSDFVAGCHCMTPAYLKNQVLSINLRCDLAKLVIMLVRVFFHKFVS